MNTTPPPAEELYQKMLAELKAYPLDCLIGIERGGAWLADRAARDLGVICASLDISFYRDDYSLRGLSGQKENSHSIPQFSTLDMRLDGKRIALIDDVIGTGRTIRAALTNLADYGRAEKIQLFTLVDRGQREMPIAPDWVGNTISFPESIHLQLTISKDNRFIFSLLS